MAIEGFSKVISSVESSYSVGLDVSEAVGVSIGALERLGRVDRPKAEESLTIQYTELAELGSAGRLFPRMSAKDVSFEDLLSAADGGRLRRGVKPAYRYAQLWTPDETTGYRGYSDADLEGSVTSSVGGLALFNPDTPPYVDPILHGLKKSYEEQQELLAKYTKEFNSQHPNRSFGAMEAKDYLMIALMDRVRGIPADSGDFILNNGSMRCMNLGGRMVDDGSFVGSVYSNDSQLRLDASGDFARSHCGFGLVVGPNKLRINL